MKALPPSAFAPRLLGSLHCSHHLASPPPRRICDSKAEGITTSAPLQGGSTDVRLCGVGRLAKRIRL